MIRLLKAIILHPLGPDGGDIWARNRLSSFGRNPCGFPPYGFDPARKMAQRGHEQRRAHIHATAQQIRFEMGLPPDNRLRG